MTEKNIFGMLTIHTKEGETINEGNVSFLRPARQRALYKWNNNYTGDDAFIYAQPFKQGYLLADDDINVGYGTFVGTNYPYNVTGGAARMNSYDTAHFRATGGYGTVPAANIPRVFGSISSANNNTGAYGNWGGGDETGSITDVPLDYTQIGTPYVHPAYRPSDTISTVAGANYITYSNGSFWDQAYVSQGGFGLVRIESGSDAGYYWIHQNDNTSNRLYLTCLDGTKFNALASASGLLMTACPGRRAWFNETSIIPLSIGTVTTGGRFNPRKEDSKVRSSFILRVTFDKSGSTEAASGTEQQGSYFVSLRPFTHGSGSLADTAVNRDEGGWWNNYFDCMYQSGYGAQPASPPNFAFWEGGVNGIDLDWDNQRVWYGYTNVSNNSGIAHWRYKTAEQFREVANYLGTATHASFLTPALVLTTGDIITSIKMGSNTGTTKNWAYVGIYHATGGNAGLAIIKPDLTTLQYRVADGIPGTKLAGCAVDKSRSRTGTAGDASTNGSDQVTSASGSFTNADVGRVIKLTGLGADSGSYKISTVAGATQVNVVTLAGAAVTFTSQSGGTFEIGDRVYFFFNDATNGSGKINYMESMAPGTFFTRSVSMTNGATIATRVAGGAGLRYGQNQLVSVDQATGNVYWISTDTQQQINKYDVTANSHSYLTIANVQTPSGGTGTLGTITLFSAIHVNSKFDHIWVGTNFGHVRIIKSTFSSATVKRYYGADNNTYENPSGFKRGSGGNRSAYVRNYFEHGDGRMSTSMYGVSEYWSDVGWYSQEVDNWINKATLDTNNTNEVSNSIHDPYGTCFTVFPSAATNSARIYLFQYEIQYQWDSGNSRWFPKEVVQTGMPNKSTSDTSNPGCLTRPIHSTAEEVMFGVKLQFNRQGGATPPNNEFLGRGGLSRATSTDGSTSIGTATFGGSAFVSGDVGKLLRIESGADAGLYKVTGFTSSVSITLSKIDGSAFSAAATAGTLTYTLWDLASPGSNAGPEDVTIMLADGFGKDNTQDITGITYDSFVYKARFYENAEGRKFCVPTPLPISGSSVKFYQEQYARTGAQYDAATSHHRALPGAEHSNGTHMLDFMVDKYLNGSGNRATVASVSGWYGALASSTAGWSGMVDFGKDVEVGFVQVRTHQVSGSYNYMVLNANYCGLIGNLYVASGSAPVASTSGSPKMSGSAGSSNLVTYTSGSTTISIPGPQTGDFLGSITTGPLSTGSTVAGASTFSASLGTFSSSDFMKVLKVTSGSDIGAYRIIDVAGDGSSVTVRNLDQTSKLWTASASGLSFEVRNAVQEEDMLCFPNKSGSVRLCIERLLSATSAQVRSAPASSGTLQAWDCMSPTWNHIKRVSNNTEALPPEVKNNGTWISLNGRENGDFLDSKIYMDLTDLPTSRRTGRWWKFSAMPHYESNAGDSTQYFSTMEFFDSSGNKIAASKYSLTDQAASNADFYFSYLSRIDFVQAAYDAATDVPGANGQVTLGGTNGDTLTLQSSARFLGFRVRTPFVDGSISSGNNQFNSATAAWTTADVGRFIRVTSGTYSGNFYRISARNSATQVTVVTPSGSAVSWGATEGSIQFTVHEGINVGGSTPDKFVFLSDNREFSIATISDNLQTITISETFQPARSLSNWEIRRPGYDTSSTTTEPAKFARLTRPMSTYPIQTGDICQDSRGHHRFFSDDIGAGTVRAGASIDGGDDVFKDNTNTPFTPDDVGRLLVITSGVNAGLYEIYAFITDAGVQLKDHITGAAVVLTADASVSYTIYGERRFRITKYVTGLRA